MKSLIASQPLFDVTDYLVDDHVGIIRNVVELRREAGAPDFFHFYARACNTDAFGHQKNFATAGGAAASREVAMAKAIGEAIERYASAIYEAEEFPVTSFDSAHFPCVPPSEFALYSERQYLQPNFPYLPFTNVSSVRWGPATDLITGETRHVPAAMIYLPYEFDKEHGESPITQRISTGLACHCSFDEAAISAICEVIERDAFTITWQGCLGMPQVRIDSLSAQNQDLVQRFESVGDFMVLINITLDTNIPTVLGVLRGGEPEAPALVFAASADLDPEKAVRKSLEELAHTRQMAQHLKRSLPCLTVGPPYDTINSKDDHVRLYCDYANLPLAEFIFGSKHCIDFGEIQNLSTGEPEQDLKSLVSKIKEIGYRVLVADITTPDVEELGLRVVRSVIPGFHPLFMGHRLRALGGSRLWEVSQKLGYRGISRELGDNSAPHPYP